MSLPNLASAEEASNGAIAGAFVAARLEDRALADFPGEIPADLASAYAIQHRAIALWPDEVAGWKVGRIAGDDFGVDRLTGPIFRRGISIAAAGLETTFPVFDGGFAAVEGEFVFRLGRDVAPTRTDWTPAQARSMCDALFVGVETAGSPLASINALGPAVVVSDFGNNDGLILGPQVDDWQARRDEDLTVEVFVDSARAGAGRASDLPGGPLMAVAFLLNQLTRLGRAAPAGTLVSTGAVGGVHGIVAGQRARVRFGDLGEILCVAQARPGRERGRVGHGA